MKDASTDNTASREYMEQIISRHAPALLRVAYNITGSYEESEDVTQEVFIRLYRKRPVFVSQEHEKAWLIRVTINEARNRMRYIGRVFPAREGEEQVLFPDDDQRVVAEAVRSLDEKYRIVIHLHYYEGYTISQMAGLLKIPASTAGTRLERAKAKLRSILKSEGFE